MADYHVLVLAMSTLKEEEAFNRDERRLRKYQFVKDGKLQGEVYKGVGQLEALPQFISDNRDKSEGPKSSITHMIILATDETLQPWSSDGMLSDGKAEPEVRTCNKLKECHRSRIDLSATNKDKSIAWALTPAEDPIMLSAVEFFVRRMKYLATTGNFDIQVADENYIVVPINQNDLDVGLGSLQDHIRALYARCKYEGGDWRLWLDTHGAFREISLGMFGIMQMLAAPNKDEIEKYVNNVLADVKSIEDVKTMRKRMADGKNTVPVTGVYTVNFPDRSGAIAPIVDLTAFYSNFIGSSVKSYLNYGQYVQMSHFPDAWTDEENTQWRDDFVFVSYKHEHGQEGDSMPEVYTILSVLRNAGTHYWYDDAIETGKNWREELDEALDHCKWFLALLTEEYMGSDQCKYELANALQKDNVVLMSIDNSGMYKKLEKDLCGFVESSDGGKKSYTLSAEEFNKLKQLQQIELIALVKGGSFQPDAARFKTLPLHDDV